MKIALDKITAVSTPLVYREDAESLNARLHEGGGTDDFRFPAGLGADLRHYRAGLDVVFEGRLRGEAEGTCGRCLEAYRLPFDAPLRVVLAPRASAGEGEGDDDLGLGFYDGEEIDVTGLVVEHAILALPTIPLCREDCRGLCPHCGVNHNLRPCTCATETSPRIGGLAALANLKVTDVRGGR
ncbi:MAG TPA: DUF177 domain-containing protein [Candidatus Eisenbacteria bacterium]|nr:DUF177 domain-containing protein [Candidatus Eisenbacteria bacterium]